MATNQQPRPTWLRLSSIIHAPQRAPTPMPPVVRPSFHVRPSLRPTQTPGPPTQPTPLPAPNANPERSPFLIPAPTAPRSPIAPVVPVVVPSRSPILAATGPNTSPIRITVAPPAPATASRMIDKATTTISSPIPSKMLERAQPESPTSKLLPSSPSPLTPSPAQEKESDEHKPVINQNSMLPPEKIDKTTKMLRANNSGIASNGKSEPTTKEWGMRVITLAGDNKGAVMELSTSHKNNYFASFVNGDRSGHEGQSNNKDKANREMLQTPKAAFMNSNVQGINNSIVYNSSFSNNNPRIRLSLNTKANGGRSRDQITIE